jgi:hypothetical protein
VSLHTTEYKTPRKYPKHLHDDRNQTKREKNLISFFLSINRTSRLSIPIRINIPHATGYIRGSESSISFEASSVSAGGSRT